jgi:putative transposase
MNDNREIRKPYPMQPNRKSQRKKDYAYSQPGYYYVTTCTQLRFCLFGAIQNGEMLANDAGRMIRDAWHEIPTYYPGIELDVMQIMPNHLHGIIIIRPVGTAPRGRPFLTIRQCPAIENGQCPAIENGQARGPVPTVTLSLSDVIHRFKSLTTKRYIDGAKTNGWRLFPGKLWQRSFHDRIVRNETELNHIRTYIRNNPSQWESDENYVIVHQNSEPAAPEVD